MVFLSFSGRSGKVIGNEGIAPMKVSVIIPVYNESNHIGSLIRFLRQCPGTEGGEIIVVDAGSTDDTVALATAGGAKVLVSPRKGRAIQMNTGAKSASGDVLYFLHADTYPPVGFIDDISRAFQRGYRSGCYRLAFDYSHWFLAFNAWFTRFDVNSFRFGDQSLFVERTVFIKAGGFREALVVMEDQEIIRRIRQHARFIILTDSVTTSARKYLDNGIYKTQAVFFLIYLLYQAGVSQDKLITTYRMLLEQEKI
jgi:rSAM/selenodomain-associated transferase 2